MQVLNMPSYNCNSKLPDRRQGLSLCCPKSQGWMGSNQLPTYLGTFCCLPHSIGRYVGRQAGRQVGRQVNQQLTKKLGSKKNIYSFIVRKLLCFLAEPKFCHKSFFFTFSKSKSDPKMKLKHEIVVKSETKKVSKSFQFEIFPQ